MLKQQNYCEEKLEFFYVSVRKLMNLYKMSAYKIIDQEYFKKEIEELILLKDKLKGEEGFYNNFILRIKYLIIESVSTRQILYLQYVMKNMFEIEKTPLEQGVITSKNGFFSIIENSLSKYDYLFRDINQGNSLDLIIAANNQIKQIGSYIEVTRVLESVNESTNSACKLYLHEHLYFGDPDYFKIHKTNSTIIMTDDGTLRQHWKYYIALMAASTMKSEYLVKTLEENFLTFGGNPSWLIFGNNIIPQKLKLISKLVNLLTNQPWKIQIEDLNEILGINKDASPNRLQFWNLTELVNACIIIIKYNQISTLFEAYDFKLLEKENKTPSELNDFVACSENLENSITIPGDGKRISINEKKEGSLKNNLENEHRYRDNINEMNYYNSEKLDDSKFLENFDKYINSYHKQFAPFDSNSEKYLSSFDFNWHDHAFHILKNLNCRGAEILNNEINHLYNIKIEYNNKPNTIRPKHINSLQETQESTSYSYSTELVTAIKYYIEKIYGYYHDDYQYSNINKILKNEVKNFIKGVVCSPKNITPKDFITMNQFFTKEDTFQIVLLVILTKMRILATYLTLKFYEVIKNIE